MVKLKTILAGILLMLAGHLLADDIDLTGAWYDVEQPGWGLLIDEGEEYSFYAWFTYEMDAVDQAWYVGVSPRGDYELIPINQPLATFPAEGWSEGDAIGSITLLPIGKDKLTMSWVFDNPDCGLPTVSPSLPCTRPEGTFILERLLEIPPQPK